MHAPNIAIIDGKESLFITLCHAFHQLDIVNFWHILIVPNFMHRRREYMKKFLLATLSAIMFLSAFFAGSVSGATAKEPKILEFDTMVGVPAGLTGAQSQAVLRGINGGGLPWALTSAHGELKAG